ncbi:MAG: phosphoenolpyruvate--protein phosphotransferase [Clostridia bacterium]
MKYSGSPVSRGVVTGKVFRFVDTELKFENQQVEESARTAEVERYHTAVAEAEKQLQEIYDSCIAQGNKNAEIFQAHKDLISDCQVREEIDAAILHEGKCAEWAVSTVYCMYMQVLGASEDALIRERATDLADVSNRILRNLLHVEGRTGLMHLPAGAVLVAHDLMPSQTATLDPDKVLAIVTEVGGMTSHTAILARSLGIPAVLGVNAALETFQDGQTVTVDGLDGIIITELSVDEQVAYARKQEDFNQQKEYERTFLTREPVTKDGLRVEIHLNIGEADPTRYQSLLSYVDGAGLFRSEFLYMSRSTLPSEEEQYQVYARTLRTFGERPVILRTLDIGGDKKTDCIQIPAEENPFLGLRALRLCFAQPEIFRTQLRAAYRASVHGNLWIMFPMVNSLDDVRKAKAYLKEVQQELTAEGIPFRGDVKIGIMIETPAMALMAKEAAKEVDFASIGTNDLCQYTLAVDRLNPTVSAFYMGYHPAVLRLIYFVAEAFKAEGKPLSVCGELGGDSNILPVLVGLGIHKVSMGASSVPGAKATICGMEAEKARLLANEVLQLPTENDIKKRLGI